ncbi:hypothetical protein HBI56_006550 [Parastagonospora nodorum]|uniref:Uncharacterized protein n=1 Tax=Phaeosphaeria nodorum (strain SN15 / ATCC MYA-4574 / FGSC 10173) TaxID=321614 RepID=A0A7U2EU29_PHANO|nr:hypothetical protein HBH56_123200 [Parastagonospora nodorum]QRC91115.1 hypothetical protein JI435_401010 [Parastagonospora nodorum SN15]KAH3934854.1 hypothetical protein HBH54_048740 [Parastagonospora nodorum]KAH3950083.1 hypothetical protein HBH53_080560 [Parastagonospora nodorum]KAH3982768.1 hypothetical protein HBH51_038470 [Parastagonospora nodorum]
MLSSCWKCDSERHLSTGEDIHDYQVLLCHRISIVLYTSLFRLDYQCLLIHSKVAFDAGNLSLILIRIYSFLSTDTI